MISTWLTTRFKLSPGKPSPGNLGLAGRQPGPTSERFAFTPAVNQRKVNQFEACRLSYATIVLMMLLPFSFITAVLFKGSFFVSDSFATDKL